MEKGGAIEVRNPAPILFSEIWLSDELYLGMPSSGDDDVTGFRGSVWISVFPSDDDDDDDEEMCEKVERLSANKTVSVVVSGESAKKVDKVDVLLQLSGELIEMRIVDPDVLRLDEEEVYKTRHHIDNLLVDAGFIS